jgi:microcystin-dependent protein
MANLQVAEGLSIDNNPGFGYYPGDIIISASTFTPTGFLPCNGATITQFEYPALYSVLGTYYDPAVTVCKLPNLNQSDWFFPCSTVGNESAYPLSHSSHSHTLTNNTITAANYSTVTHTHSGSVTSASGGSGGHSHGVPAPGNSVNTASSVANRSNGSGQGVNLAIAGHTHSWGSAANSNIQNPAHTHTVSIGTTCSASDHSHTANLGTSTSTDRYIPDNVISIRYYIKW